jgi:biotin synthase
MTASLTKEECIELLQAEGDDLKSLYKKADELRKKIMGDTVFLRGIVEISNICKNNCLYCGIRAENKNLNRYFMKEQEILETALQMAENGITTIVIQAGEWHDVEQDKAIGKIVNAIKNKTKLAVTLSLGERTKNVYQLWKDCGADRYLLRFETSSPDIFSRLRPAHTLNSRLHCLESLRGLNYQLGTGFMIGLPEETISILADNILLCHKLDPDMIGIGPFIPHPDTPLASNKNMYENDKEVFFKTIAILRLVQPRSHIPATTAYDAVFPEEGRNKALQCGANIFMPNLTPKKYRKLYQLYPGKPGVDEDALQSVTCILERLKLIGRNPGKGHGNAVKIIQS